jgi:putative endonuclease
MAVVYILFSNELNRYYIGSCYDLRSRLKEHREKKYAASYTTKVSDWEVFFLLENLSYSQARNIENHIKKMKSRGYIVNLSRYPEMKLKLIRKYS